MRRAAAYTAVVLVVSVWTAFPAVVAAATATVKASGTSFTPSTVTITVGDTVTWQYAPPEDQYHTVTAKPGSAEMFDSDPSGQCASSHYDGCLGPEQGKNIQSFSHRFTKAGSFGYYCKVHATPSSCGMCGTVVVRAPTPPPATPRPAQPAVTAAPANPTSAPAAAVTASPAASPSATPALSPSPTPSGSPLALDDETETSGGLSPLAIALIALAGAGLLGGAAYLGFAQSRRGGPPAP